MFLCLEVKALHPLKMSVTDIVYKDKKLYLKCKLFTDDLEMTLRTFCNKGQIDLINVGFDATATKCLQHHFQKNFFLTLNGTPVKFTFKKVYLSGNIEVAYVEMEASVKLLKENKVTVNNTLMFSNLPEQKSVVNLTREGTTKTLLIENEKEEKAKEVLF